MPRKRVSIKWVIVTLVLAGTLVFGAVWSVGAYKRWQERRFLASANALLLRGNYRAANLAARSARQFNPDSAAAYRVLATAAERQDDRSAISLRGRIADLEPGSVSSALEWARTALRFGAPDVAEKALARIAPADRTTADYYETAADLAKAHHDRAAEELDLGEAIAADPSRLSNQLRFAVLLLSSSDQSKAAAGRAQLEKLLEEPAMRAMAARAMVRNALEHEQFENAAKIAEKLETYPDATFADRLRWLTALDKSRDPRFPEVLKAIGQDETVRSAKAAELIDWMLANNMAPAALEWMSTLGPEMMNKGEMGPVLARVYLAVEDWQGLERWANTGNWSERESLRRAYLARALQKQGRDSEFRQEQAASINAAKSAFALERLAQLFGDWGWESTATDLLWRLLDFPSMRDATLEKLYAQYSANGDSKGLYKLMLRLAAARPDDVDVQNNIAQLSLLLRMNLDWAHKIASRVYEKNPTNPSFVSTYAFSCYLKGEKNTALRVLGALPSEQLREPAVAAYYGVILMGSSEQAKAWEFLAIAERASLLPEERALVANAMRMGESSR